MNKITLTKETIILLSGLDAEDLQEVITALPIAMDGDEVSLRGMGRIVFPMIQREIDRQKRTSRVKSEPLTNLIYAYDTESFRESWEMWLSYRREIKKTIKGLRSAQGQMNKLAKLSNGNEETARAIIMQSIENNWTGLFEIKNNTNGQQKSITSQEEHDANRQAVERLTAKYQNR